MWIQTTGRARPISEIVARKDRFGMNYKIIAVNGIVPLLSARLP
jgi:hypothetical protein